VPVIHAPDYTDKTITAIRDLCHDGQPLTEETHATCPGRAAYLHPSWGEPPVQAVHVCTDPSGHGHAPRYGGSLPARSGPLSDDEKAERARVRENNAAWRSAETVRRDWLRGFLARKTAPKDAPVFLAHALAAGDHALRRALERGHPLGRDMLGADNAATGWNAAARQLGDLLAKASPARAQMVGLGLALAAYEDATGVHSWRNPDPATRRYLAYLVANGYTPSDVERLVLDTEDTDDPADEADEDQDDTPTGEQPAA
jgi:ParB family chromosome partitioning protein